MKPDDYMRRAIAVAHQSKKDDGVAIGAILVHEATGTVLSNGESIVGLTKDPTAHAEVNCIRAACAELGTDDLFDYTLYSTLEPCHMCLSAAAWARIPRVYFGAYRKDVNPDLFETAHERGDEAEASHMNLRESTHMQVQGGVLEQECAALLQGYRDRPKHSPAILQPEL